MQEREAEQEDLQMAPACDLEEPPWPAVEELGKSS